MLGTRNTCLPCCASACLSPTRCAWMLGFVPWVGGGDEHLCPFPRGVEGFQTSGFYSGWVGGLDTWVLSPSGAWDTWVLY